jgi:hypothetical protein
MCCLIIYDSKSLGTCVSLFLGGGGVQDPVPGTSRIVRAKYITIGILGKLLKKYHNKKT